MTKPNIDNRIISYEEFLELWEKNREKHPKRKIIKELKDKIQQYEAKYKMESGVFAERFKKGEFEMDDTYPDNELFSWYTSYLSCQELLSDSHSEKKD